jgi:uncharacterized protein YxeA
MTAFDKPLTMLIIILIIVVFIVAALFIFRDRDA